MPPIGGPFAPSLRELCLRRVRPQLVRTLRHGPLVAHPALFLTFVDPLHKFCPASLVCLSLRLTATRLPLHPRRLRRLRRAWIQSADRAVHCRPALLTLLWCELRLLRARTSILPVLCLLLHHSIPHRRRPRVHPAGFQGSHPPAPAQYDHSLTAAALSALYSTALMMGMLGRTITASLQLSLQQRCLDLSVHPCEKQICHLAAGCQVAVGQSS